MSNLSSVTVERKSPRAEPTPLRPGHRHIVIERLSPSVDGGAVPAKRVVGDQCTVGAHIYREGPNAMRAVARCRHEQEELVRESQLLLRVNDEWEGQVRFDKVGRYFITVAAWTDELATWHGWALRKAKAGEDLRPELLEGLELAQRLIKAARPLDRRVLEELQIRFRSASGSEEAAQAEVLDPRLATLVEQLDVRLELAVSEPIEIVVEPQLASFGAWYELFPRSQGSDPRRASTLREAERRLPEIRDLGFQILYLPPIHPIGTTNRKGRNNALVAGPGDPGSPWQIGNKAGGHTAIEPALGTLDDFDHFLRTARSLDLEIALDFAIQCSPDHPWVEAHPEWFAHRPDGSIKYAENPPKKYQDIYPINFDTTDERGLWMELRRVLFFWIERGVRVFRVDNPHTKPVRFWAWVIGEVKKSHPEVIFLAEAFTRPKMMNMLAKIGFSQSYTYFTWRETKAELIEYLTELTQTEQREYFRPNFFANTPDILPPILQTGGRSAFQMRLILAATLSPSYGIYSGFELCESDAIAGTEEYQDSEKYQVKVRNWNAPGNIKELVARVNGVRQRNPALQQLTNLQFLETNNDQLLAYLKSNSDGTNLILVVVNLDPHHPHHGTVRVPPAALGAGVKDYWVNDLLSGACYQWSEYNYVRLDPETQVAHIFRLENIR